MTYFEITVLYFTQESIEKKRKVVRYASELLILSTFFKSAHQLFQTFRISILKFLKENFQSDHQNEKLPNHKMAIVIVSRAV